MIKRISKITLIFHFFTTLSYGQMRTLDDLIDSVDPGWPFVKQWIDSAKNRVEILPGNIENAKRALHETQVTTRSPMGAIIYATGGLLLTMAGLEFWARAAKDLRVRCRIGTEENLLRISDNLRPTC